MASQCRQCAVDSSETDSACISCPPGQYMLNGTGVCRSCPPNTFIRPEQPLGEEACIPCGPNTKSNQVSSVFFLLLLFITVHEIWVVRSKCSKTTEMWNVYYNVDISSTWIIYSYLWKYNLSNLFPLSHYFQARSACVSDCTVDIQYKGETLQYDFSPLASVTHFQSSPRFTNRGLRYVHQFSVGLCGTEVNAIG